mgnify:CR=1 FL=1
MLFQVSKQINVIVDVVVTHLVRAANEKLGPGAGEWLDVLLTLLDDSTRKLIIEAVNTTKLESKDGMFVDESTQGSGD